MVFFCQQCGECCSSMGEVIGIQDQIGPTEFVIRYTITGEERRVWIDPDKEDLFFSRDIRTRPPLACPFLRERSPDCVVCTVHYTRPDLCRQYSCFRILVLGPDGTRLGRVVDRSRVFVTLDRALRAFWDREIARSEISDESAWEVFVERMLVRAGYRVIR